MLSFGTLVINFICSQYTAHTYITSGPRFVKLPSQSSWSATNDLRYYLKVRSQDRAKGDNRISHAKEVHGAFNHLRAILSCSPRTLGGLYISLSSSASPNFLQPLSMKLDRSIVHFVQVANQVIEINNFTHGWKWNHTIHACVPENISWTPPLHDQIAGCAHLICKVKNDG